MHGQDQHKPFKDRSGSAASGRPGHFSASRRALAVALAACLAVGMLAWPSGTRSARPRDLAVSIDPTSGIAGSNFSITAASFSSFVNQHTAFIQFDMNGQPVTIGQPTIGPCLQLGNSAYGFGKVCGSDVSVTVPSNAAPGLHTVTVHVPNANPLVVGGSIDLQTTFTVIASDTPTATATATPSATGTVTSTATGTATPTATGTALATGTATATATVTATASATSTGLPSGTPTRTPSATATTPPATNTPVKNTATPTATAVPSRPVTIWAKPFFSIGKLVLTIHGRPSAKVSVSLAITRSQKGAGAAVYRVRKSGTLDTAGGLPMVLPITYHGRGMATLVVVVQGPAMSVQLRRTYRYSG
jgi:hypothetical protein